MPTPQADEGHDAFVARCVPIVLEDGTADDQEQAVAICESIWEDRDNVAELEQGYIREFVTGEFKGDFPEVPPAPGVDLDALKDSDPDPFFVTLPVARVDEVSNNGLVYDEPLVESIISQINDEHPTGIMGHLRDEDRASAYPVPDAYWVGALRVGNTAWAKAYIPPGQARDTLRRKKAVGGKAATSIYGPPGRRVLMGNGRWRADGFKLESLDLAPYERAALKLGGAFAVTAEMESQRMTDPEEDTDMASRDEIIAELGAGDIPEPVREQIINEWRERNDQATRIAELEQQVSERDSAISELQESLATYRVAEFETAVDAAIAELTSEWKVPDTDKAREKLAVLQGTLRSQVVAEMGEERDTERLAEVVTEVWERSKPLAEMVRDALAGPPARVPSRDHVMGKQLEDTPENRRAARASVGL